jgi:hypothetical protein
VSVNQGHRAATREKTADHDEWTESTVLLRFDAPIEPMTSGPKPGAGLKRRLTVRQKIARWLEEKL